MNWIKENKFLTGFIAVMLLGCGALGFLAMTAGGKYTETEDAFAQSKAELARLQGLAPFPSKENLKKLEDQRKEATDAVNTLHRNLAAAEIPIEALTPEQFQDKLRASVTDVKAKAGQRPKLPEKFYMGFDKYETEPPERPAAGPLGRQLKAMQWLVEQFIEVKAVEIRELGRDELPEEKSKGRAEKPAAPAALGAPAAGKEKDKDKGDKQKLVTKHAFWITVLLDQNALRKVLNSIVTSKEQFFIVRTIEVKNEKDRGPSRIDPNAAQPAAPVAPADPNAKVAAAAAPAAPPTSIIVGEERVEVTLRIEIIDFADLPAAK